MKIWPQTGLWLHRDFLNLWAAQIVSAFGSRITRTALPALAITTLGASDGEVALLGALGVAPAILVSLAASSFIDRLPKRPLMIWADLSRALLVASVPLAAWLATLSMEHLYAVAIVSCLAGAMFQIADQAFLPVIVSRPDLVEGNAKLGATDSLAEIAGPGIAGILIQIVTAPVAMVIDAASYIWSAFFLGQIRVAEPPPAAEKGSRLSRALAGIAAMWASPYVRPMFMAEALGMLSWGFFASLYMLFALRELGLDIATTGLIIGVGGIGAFAGAVLSSWGTRMLGFGPAMLLFLAVNMGAAVFLPLAQGSGIVSIVLLVAHQIVGDGFAVAYGVQARSLRQSIMPRAVLGRVAAAQVTMQASMMTLGALAAVPLAEALGTRTTVWIAVAIGLAGILPLLASPVIRLRRISDAESPPILP